MKITTAQQQRIYSIDVKADKFPINNWKWRLHVHDFLSIVYCIEIVFYIYINSW